jgi:hypothetical protein
MVGVDLGTRDPSSQSSLLKEALRLLPDLLRLLKRLTTDRTQPTGVRVRVALLFAYLAIPIDLPPRKHPAEGAQHWLLAPTISHTSAAGSASRLQQPPDQRSRDVEAKYAADQSPRHLCLLLSIQRSGNNRTRSVSGPMGASHVESQSVRRTFCKPWCLVISPKRKIVRSKRLQMVRSCRMCATF